MYKDINIKDYGYIGVSALGPNPVDYTEKQIDKLMREEGLMETLDNPIKETKKGESNEMKLTRIELERIAEEIRLAAIETTPVVETPEVETPKVETPKIETPEVETPKVETPKVETPKVETPKMEFFEVEANSPASIKGIKYKGRIGIDISDFSFKICTASNQAVYKHVRVFKGSENDPWKYWGKFRGVFKEPVNGRREAEFEFYVIGGRILVSYWKSEPYIRIARKLAARAINKLNNVLK